MTTDTMSSERPVANKETWKRGFFMVLFAILYSIAEFVIFVTAFVQFLFLAFTGQGNEKLTKFGDGLAVFAGDVIRYLTLKTDTRPYPFKDWHSD